MSDELTCDRCALPLPELIRKCAVGPGLCGTTEGIDEPGPDRRVSLRRGHGRVSVSWRNASNGLTTADLLRHLEYHLDAEG